MQVPVAAVLNANTKRDTGKKAQHGNIAAAKVLDPGTSVPQPTRFVPATCNDYQDHTDMIKWHMMQAVADIVRTTLGPRAMLKMLLDASGGGG